MTTPKTPTRPDHTDHPPHLLPPGAGARMSWHQRFRLAQRRRSQVEQARVQHEAFVAAREQARATMRVDVDRMLSDAVALLNELLTGERARFAGGARASWSTPALRAAHAAHAAGCREDWAVNGEREYQAARHRHRKVMAVIRSQVAA